MLNYTLEVYSSSKTVSNSIVQGHSIVVGNLSENREYSFRVLAANSVGTVSSSNRQFCKFLHNIIYWTLFNNHC